MLAVVIALSGWFLIALGCLSFGVYAALAPSGLIDFVHRRGWAPPEAPGDPRLVRIYGMSSIVAGVIGTGIGVFALLRICT